MSVSHVVLLESWRTSLQIGAVELKSMVLCYFEDRIILNIFLAFDIYDWHCVCQISVKWFDMLDEGEFFVFSSFPHVFFLDGCTRTLCDWWWWQCVWCLCSFITTVCTWSAPCSVRCKYWSIGSPLVNYVVYFVVNNAGKDWTVITKFPKKDIKCFSVTFCWKNRLRECINREWNLVSK